MSRKAKCSNCQQWYYNDDGLFISRPSTYDSSMCPQCNAEIDAQIASRTPEITFYGKTELTPPSGLHQDSKIHIKEPTIQTKKEAI